MQEAAAQAATTETQLELTPEAQAAIAAQRYEKRMWALRQTLLTGAVRGMHQVLQTEYLDKPRERDIAIKALETEAEIARALSKMPVFGYRAA